MKKTTLLLAIFFLTGHSVQSQGFQFSNNKIGSFSAEWFSYINEGDTSVFSYDSDKESRDFLGVLRDLSVMKKGIVPVMISYEIELESTIYSKEVNGEWVKVILGLNEKDEIITMSIKKASLPNYSPGYRNLSEEEVGEVLSNIVESLEKEYVRSEKGLRYADWLRGKMAADTYSQITQTDLLAKKLTEDLIEISGDKHLGVIPPTQINAVRERFGVDIDLDPRTVNFNELFNGFRFEGGLESESMDLEPTESPSPEPDSESDKFISSEKLVGNIGYITMERFVGDEDGLEQIANTFVDLTGVDKLIIDLRQSGGGDGEAAEYILSVLNGDAKELGDVFQYVELVVLTSSKSISAAESLAYRIKESNRGVLIGQTTAGAGYMVDVFDIGHGFYFVNSVAISFDESKGEGWQGTGVEPDIKVPVSEALDVALQKLNEI